MNHNQRLLRLRSEHLDTSEIRMDFMKQSYFDNVLHP